MEMRSYHTPEAHTARIEHEYSIGWMNANPELAAKWLVRDLMGLINRKMKVSIDTSRDGFITLIGEAR